VSLSSEVRLLLGKLVRKNCELVNLRRLGKQIAGLGFFHQSRHLAVALWIVTVSGETIAGVRAVWPFEASQLLTPTVRQLYVARALRLAPFERTPLEI
jgi:hypothetical protein